MLKELLGLLLLCLFLIGCSSVDVTSPDANSNTIDSGQNIVPEKLVEQKPVVEKEQYHPQASSPQQQEQSQPQEKPFCQGTGAVNFTASPMDVLDLDYINPLGLMIGCHVTPIDHQYYYAKSWSPQPAKVEDLKDVHVPAAGVVREVQRMPGEYTTSDIGDYRIIIDHSCTFYTIYIHLNLLSSKLSAMVGDRGRTPVTVEAGEVIGKARSFDFSVHNEDVRLKGFIVPEHYDGEAWKIHTVDPFDYFVEPLRSSLLEKDIRTAVPRGGKIDYDIDGKLMGNWFVKGSGGYSGKNHGEYGYWKNHLAFAPDGLDPSHLVASLGDFNGEAKQFGIKGNVPDPAHVDVTSGLVKYELVSANYVDRNGQFLDGGHFTQGVIVKNGDAIEGVLVVQLVDGRTLKAEVFPGKKVADVSGFVNPMVYER